jgi:predicted nucleic acid-binding Zn ribbon protein
MKKIVNKMSEQCNKIMKIERRKKKRKSGLG